MLTPAGFNTVELKRKTKQNKKPEKSKLDFWAREPLEATALFTRGDPGSQSQTAAVWSGGTLTAQTQKKLKNLLTFITLAVASQRHRDPRRDDILNPSPPPPTPPSPAPLR